MLDQLKKTLKEKVDGLDDKQAQQAAEAAINFLKDKLPAPIAGRLEELVDGDGKGDVDFGQLGKTISGFLGK